jgi:glycosyltransferase involved in cell wall biosynthesis
LFVKVVANVQVLNDIFSYLPFQLLLTDPTSKRSITRERLDSSVTSVKKYLERFPFVEIRHFQTRQEYYEALQSVDVGLAPWRRSALWSMATVDVMSTSRPVVAPRYGVFEELVCDRDLLFTSEKEFGSIVERLLQDVEYRTAKGQVARKNTVHLAPDLIADKFEEIFGRVTNHA